jgi:hypothetical protein
MNALAAGHGFDRDLGFGRNLDFDLGLDHDPGLVRGRVAQGGAAAVELPEKIAAVRAAGTSRRFAPLRARGARRGRGRAERPIRARRSAACSALE